MMLHRDNILSYFEMSAEYGTLLHCDGFALQFRDLLVSHLIGFIN